MILLRTRLAQRPQQAPPPLTPQSQQAERNPFGVLRESQTSFLRDTPTLCWLMLDLN
jgi:hypothetical protein